MIYRSILTAGAFALLAGVAGAQTPAEKLIGTWKGASSAGGPCGENIAIITKVEANGTVRGTFECVLRKMILELGDRKVLDRNMQATLKGNHLVIEGANSGFDLTLEGDQLKGTGQSGTVKRPITLTKQ